MDHVVPATPKLHKRSIFFSSFLLFFWARCKRKNWERGGYKEWIVWNGSCDSIQAARLQGWRDVGSRALCMCVCGGEHLSSDQLRRKLSGRGHMTAVVMTSKRHPVYKAQPCSSPGSQRLRLSSTLNLHFISLCFHSPNILCSQHGKRYHVTSDYY